MMCFNVACPGFDEHVPEKSKPAAGKRPSRLADAARDTTGVAGSVSKGVVPPQKGATKPLPEVDSDDDELSPMEASPSVSNGTSSCWFYANCPQRNMCRNAASRCFTSNNRLTRKENVTFLPCLLRALL